MAADATVYYNNGAVLRIKQEGVVQFDALIALKLLAYGSNIKTLFYLDGVLQIGATSDNAFIGYCHASSAKLAYHASARWGKLRLNDGTDVVVFNDGGLNTLGSLASLTVTNKAVSNIVLQAIFKSAYYCDSTDYGFYYRQNLGAKNKRDVGALAKNTQITATNTLVTPGINAGDRIDVTAYIVNSEGEREDLTLLFYAEARSLVMKFNASYASYAYTGSNNQTVYAGNANLNLDTILYNGADTSTASGVPSGYYTYADYWYEVRLNPLTELSEIVAFGPCVANGWPTSDPAYDDGSYTAVTFEAYSTSTSNICSLSNSVTLYRKNSTQKHYTTSALTTLAANGYYKKPTGFYHQMTAGTLSGTASGNCGA